MSAPSDQQSAQEVSTEPQRRALDEMSHQLVEKLNAMVREQNERAEHFAATQHSLSPLPELPAVPTAPTAGKTSPTQRPDSPAQAEAPAQVQPHKPREERKKLTYPTLPQRHTQPNTPQPAPSKLPWDTAPPNQQTSSFPVADKKKSEESGCGSGTIITLIVIIIIILRSCS